MTSHFLRSYSLLLIKTCHRRGAYAMGGMVAHIPIKGDEDANAAAVARVHADKEREATDVHITQMDLLKVDEGTFTEDVLRNNLNVGIQYVEAWVGCVPLYKLMEDAATAEISRAKVWHWLKRGAAVNGTAIDVELVARMTDE